MKISVIVPCFNIISKIQCCIDSLSRQTLSIDKFEVIFVDDCSTDGSYLYLKEKVSDHKNWKVFQLNKNSGSPSKPRNYGVEKATGDYIFYLDADDELLVDTLEAYINFAEKEKVDVLRGYLIVNDGSTHTEFNKIYDFNNALVKKEIVEKIIKSQSTTVCQLIKRNLLISNNIQWPEEIRMGEDTIFLLNVFKHAGKISYIDHPTFIYNKIVSKVKSSTQQYGHRELNNHLLVWETAEKLMRDIGSSYYKLRLKIGIKSVIESFLNYYSHDLTSEDFLKFSKFIEEIYPFIDINSFDQRFIKIINLIKDNKFDLFLDEIKPKLLIAGYDLKFILPAIPYLSEYYNIKVDEWKGHEAHDVNNSKNLLVWAEIIWCEWLLGNAVWYADNKLPHQKLFIRVHRFELTTKYTQLVDFSKVDKVMTVSIYFFEKTVEILKIERSKVTLLPNYLITDMYLKSDDEEKYFNLGMIGILPSGKGFHNSLLILKALIEKDVRYKLNIYGKNPNDLPWIKNDTHEMSYFNKCEEFILENNLKNNIIFHGWSNIYQEAKDIGYILSLSKNDELFESFHIAPAEAFCSNNIGLLLDWRGVEYIYPSEYIFQNVSDIVKTIENTNKDRSLFDKMAKNGRDFIDNNYSIEIFCSRVKCLLG